MTRKQSGSPPEPAKVTAEAMKAAIPRLQTRIKELDAFDPNSVEHGDDPRIEVLTSKIDHTLVQIFGSNSVEYFRYKVFDLGISPQDMFRGTPIPLIREGLRNGIENATAKLNAIIEIFQEQLEISGQAPGADAKEGYTRWWGHWP